MARYEKLGLLALASPPGPFSFRGSDMCPLPWVLCLGGLGPSSGFTASWSLRCRAVPLPPYGDSPWKNFNLLPLRRGRGHFDQRRGLRGRPVGTVGGKEDRQNTPSVGPETPSVTVRGGRGIPSQKL